MTVVVIVSKTREVEAAGEVVEESKSRDGGESRKKKRRAAAAATSTTCTASTFVHVVVFGGARLGSVGFLGRAMVAVAVHRLLLFRGRLDFYAAACPRVLSNIYQVPCPLFYLFQLPDTLLAKEQSMQAKG